MMPLTGHLVLYSIGLIASAAIAIVAKFGLRRDPSACHRILIAIVYASLFLPIAQLVVENVAPAGRSPAGPLVQRIARELVPASTASAAEADGALPAQPAAPIAPASAGAKPPAPARPTQAVRTAPAANAKRTETHPPAGRSEKKAAATVATTHSRSPLSVAISFVRAAGREIASLRGRILEHADRVAWIWAGGAFLFLIAQGLRLLRTARFLSACTPVQDPEVLDVWRRVAHGSPLFHRIRLLASDQLSAPACWGALTPAIVLPSATLVERRTLAFALLHELVHLERRDPRTRLAQGVFVALYWFHPAAWWLSLSLDRVREQSCDQDVVHRVGRAKSYALALVHYAALPSINADPLPTALHWSRSHSQLRRRILMLSESRAPASRGRRLMYAGAAGLVLAAAWASQITIASAFPANGGVDSKLVAFCPPKTDAKPKSNLNQNQKPAKKMRAQPGRADEPQTPPPAGSGSNNATDVTLSPSVNSALNTFRTNITLPVFNLAPQNSNLVTFAQPAQLDDEVREALIRTLLRDDHPSVRRAAAEALAPFVGDARVKEAIVATLHERNDEETKAMLLETLLAREAISADVREVLHSLVGGDARATQDDSERRQRLIARLLDESDRARQTDAALALAGGVDDEEVRGALMRLLMKGSNEPARMVALKALSPWLTQTDDVRELFVMIVQRDSNPAAKGAAADALVTYVGDENVRRALVAALMQSEDTVLAQRFVLALAPFARDDEVKHAFIGALAHAGDEGIRTTLVDALSSASRAVTYPTYFQQMNLYTPPATTTPVDAPPERIPQDG